MRSRGAKPSVRLCDQYREEKMARLREDLEAINQAKTSYYGYLNIDLFKCPPFIMFTNN
jgi:hypothetical protein